MTRNIVTLIAATVVAFAAGGCGSSAPTTPTPTPTPVITPGPTPNIAAPTAQSPNNQVLAGLTATYTASTATVDLQGYVLQYRFQVFGDGDMLIQDSGLLAAPTFASTLVLTPNKRYAWKVRAESQGFAGAWSSTASFTTPDPPPAYKGTIGNWQACASEPNRLDIVRCVWNAVHPYDSVSDMEVIKRVAWLLRGEGAGLLIKASGENVIMWQGYPLSCSRICYPDGHIYKLLADVGPGGANSPQWADGDFVDRSLYVPAIDPAKP